MKLYLIVSLLLSSFTAAYALENSTLQNAIEGNHRSEQQKNRDQFRHPFETLNFFEVEANMTVVEIWPGGSGWYTEILAPYLKEKGTLYAAQFSANTDITYYTKNLQKFKSKLLAQPTIYNKVIITTLHSPQFLNIAPNDSADRVLTFRNVHNWMKSGQTEKVFIAMYKALKKGGILGLVEHRSSTETKHDPNAKSGYVAEAYIISLAEKAGFKLLAKSEINANSKDTTNHLKGVWTLPPSLKLKDQDREKYLAIGESDRMTLKFIKP